MSEYQYYEFQTIDRPLTPNEQAAIRQLSSRVELSSTRAVFTYSYADFRGEPKQVLAKYFDAMFYIANWGTQQLMFRFPKSLLDFEEIQKYCLEDFITLSVINNHVILEIQFDEEEGCGWIEETDYLSSLVELRNDILQQDYRMLYLAWLRAITLDALDEEESEPPVPPGLGHLSRPLNAFVELFGVDDCLLKAAAKLSCDRASISDTTLLQAIKKLSRKECDTFLLRLANGQPHLPLELNKKLSEIITAPQPEYQPQRTIKQLFEAAEREREQEVIRQTQEAEKKRLKELEKLAKREADAWNDVEQFIQKSQAKTYDEAVKLLLKLQDLAIHQNKKSDFRVRLNHIHDQYSKRSAFIKRLNNVGLYHEVSR
ncbi:MAG: hypothetical protein LDL41_05175 [Coleofasciculus sp. S288]|nr:hypothetical protein [Coleofasciculus sp. S288]